MARCIPSTSIQLSLLFHSRQEATHEHRNTITPALFLAIVGLFGGCALNPHPMDMTTAVRNAKTPADHQALADHYEQAAQEADGKAAEHRQTL